MPFRTADSAVVPVPVAAVFTLPHGVVVPRVPRGIYWEPCLSGDCHVAFLVDSLGDRRNSAVRVAIGAPASVYEAAEAELWDLLDRIDPPLRLIR